MKSLSRTVMAATAAAAAGLGFIATAGADQKEVMIGAQCDRTGPTQIVGVVICPAQQDYMDLINSTGGIEGYKINYNELDNEYKVPPAVEEYERQKGAGALSLMIRHASGPGAQPEAPRGQDSRHLARLRHRRLGRRQALSLSLPDGGDLLVAGRRCRQVRQGQIGW